MAALMDRRAAALAAILCVLLSLEGCERPKTAEAKKTTAASKVEKLPGEADLTTIHLNEEAERNLRIATATVSRKPVARVRTYGGEVIVPPGRAVTVSAPLSGTLMPPTGGKPPKPGESVKKGQEVFRLQPLLSPEAQATLATTRVEAQGQVDQAEKGLAQARIQLERAGRLRREQLGGSGALADAQAQYDIAESTLKAATSRRDALDKAIKGIEGGTLEAQPILAEADGSIKGVHVMQGQVVNAGAMLFDIEALDRVWVRVPVYVGDRRVLDLKAEARVGDLTEVPGQSTRPARPMNDAPPSGDPLAATVHLFYEVSNDDHTFWPGQRVGVTVPFRGQDEGLVVPRAALLHDYHGGTWVYQKVAPRTYSRRRVRLDRIAGDLAVLLQGVEPGAEVVTSGAAELFGAEFGGAK
jgi:cobalt-zinc-cadmium efflux system membrane fusion protein